MSRRKGSESIAALVNHWRWLVDQAPSYKLQAASGKRQAASLTTQHSNHHVYHQIKAKKNKKKKKGRG